MEGLEKVYSKMWKDTKSAASASASSSSLSEFAENLMPEKRSSGNLTSYDGSGILVNWPPSGISVWTCSKLCAIFFVAGVFVGYTLKKWVRSWASKLLKSIKDD